MQQNFFFCSWAVYIADLTTFPLVMDIACIGHATLMDVFTGVRLKPNSGKFHSVSNERLCLWAVYIADSETGVEKKPTIPWQPVLFNGVLTGCLASFLFGYHVG
jgi:hypothetical protein